MRSSALLLRSFAAALAVVMLAIPRAGSGQAVPLNRDPAAARIVTDDIGRFWAAFDGSRPGARNAAFERDYLARGTPGLKAFVAARIGNASKLAAAVDAQMPYYRAVRASTLRVPEFELQIRQAFVRYQQLDPDAVFPDVYFVIGRGTSGGTTEPGVGLLIGTEVDALPAAHPAAACVGGNAPWLCSVAAPVERIPFIVAHELTHIEQNLAHGEPSADEKPTLLLQSLAEGSADYLAERVTGLPRHAPYVTYGAAHRAAIRTRFLAERAGLETRDWLYNDPRTPGWPHDLGYEVGYQIAKGYVMRARDERAAIRALIALRDPEAILAASGYATVPAR